MQGRLSNTLFSIPKKPLVKVKLSAASKPDNQTPTGARLCGICHKVASSYICPQCNIPYCNLICYQGHNVKCTESFYKKQVRKSYPELQKQEDSEFLKSLRQGLNLNSNSEEYQKQAQNEENNKEDNQNFNSDLIDFDHLNELNHFENISLNDLSEVEKQHFLNSVSTGMLSNEISTWIPWWEEEEEKEIFIKPIDSINKSKTISDYYQNLLLAINKLPDFSTVSKRPASKLMRYLLSDILFSYCTMIRTYNGDYHTDSTVALSMLIKNSLVLSNDKRHENMTQVVNSGVSCLHIQNDIHSEQNQSTNYGLSFYDDVRALLKQRKYILCALVDCRNLIYSASPSSSSSSSPPPSSSSTWETSHSRKLWFFLIWANGASNHHFCEAAVELAEACEDAQSLFDRANQIEPLKPLNYQISPGATSVVPDN